MADHAENDRSSRPLAGVVLCCTSIPLEQRIELSSRAEEMGALHHLDLTSDVTHLIVGDIDTPKYKYVAKERPDVKVLDMSWVEAVRRLWMSDDIINLQALEQEHRLPTFCGLRICLTGFEDLTERQRLQTNIIKHGAEYHADLTKAVTHLLALKAQGEKYKHANQWGIKVIAAEWLDQSIERGMVLEESLYDPVTPKLKRGRNAWIRRTVSETSLGKHRRADEQTGGSIDPADVGRRKLRRTASNKLTSQNSSIWDDIVGGGFGKREGQEAAEIESRLLDSAGNPGKENRRPTTVHDMRDGKKLDKKGIFHGQRMYLHGFDKRKTTVVGAHLLSHDADIVCSLPALASGSSETLGNTYVVIPHDSSPESFPQLDACVTAAHNLVTEFWVERCIFRKTFIKPGLDVASRPFEKFPIPSFRGKTICSTGFCGIDLLHVSKIVQLMGASYNEYFTCKAAVLICNAAAPSQEKLRLAFKWNVVAVNASWFWDSVESGAWRPYEAYLIRTPGFQTDAARPPDGELNLSDRTKVATERANLIDSMGERSREPSEDLTIEEAARRARKKRAAADEIQPDIPLMHTSSPQHKNDCPTAGKAISKLDSDLSSPVTLPTKSTLKDTSPRIVEPTKARKSPSCPHPQPLSHAQAPPQPSAVVAPAVEVEDLKWHLASPHAQKTSRPSSNDSKSTPLPSNGTRPRRQPPSRLLGRAPSAGSMAHSLSRAQSVDSAATSQPIETSILDLDPRVALGLAPNAPHQDESQLPEPSQKVTCDDHEALEMRERLLRRMGGSEKNVEHKEGLKGRVGAIGVARDLSVKGRLRGTR